MCFVFFELSLLVYIQLLTNFRVKLSAYRMGCQALFAHLLAHQVSDNQCEAERQQPQSVSVVQCASQSNLLRRDLLEAA